MSALRSRITWDHMPSMQYNYGWGIDIRTKESLLRLLLLLLLLLRLLLTIFAAASYYSEVTMENVEFCFEHWIGYLNSVPGIISIHRNTYKTHTASTTWHSFRWMLLHCDAGNCKDHVVMKGMCSSPAVQLCLRYATGNPRAKPALI